MFTLKILWIMGQDNYVVPLIAWHSGHTLAGVVLVRPRKLNSYLLSNSMDRAHSKAVGDNIQLNN